QGVRDARTVVKVGGPQAPMIETELSGQRNGDTVSALESTLRATVTAGQGATLRVIKNGETLEAVEVDADPFVHEFVTEAPPTGEDRYRHELADDANHVLTVTSYVWLQRADPTPTPTVTPPATPTVTQPVRDGCAGDCDFSESVDIDEL